MARGGTSILVVAVGAVMFVDWVKQYWPVLVGAIVVAIIAVMYDSHASSKRERLRKEQRESHLLTKYGTEVADKILKASIWVDQTTEQLLDARGKPYAIDQKFLKTKVREVWKYDPGPRGGCRLRITIENGRVVSWDRRI